jgi:hypothetical protein
MTYIPLIEIWIEKNNLFNCEKQGWKHKSKGDNLFLVILNQKYY